MNVENRAAVLDMAVPGASLPQDKPADCSDTTPSPAEWVLPGLIPKNQVTLLSGPGGGYKSLWAIQAAYSLAAGSPVLGIPSTGRVPSIFVSCEDDMDELLRRQQRWAEHIGIWDTDEAEVPFMFMPRIVEDSCLCEHCPTSIPAAGSFFPKLAHVLSQVPESLVILDPVSHFWLGNENSSSQVTEFVNDCLGSLIKAYDCTILAVNRTWNAPGAPYPGSKALYDAFPNQLWLEQDAAQRTWFYEGKRRATVPGKLAATQLEWNEGIVVPVRDAA